jgi:hypothetical protein
MIVPYERKPTLFETLPAEVAPLISEHMSVKDFVRVMQVRRPQNLQKTAYTDLNKVCLFSLGVSHVWHICGCR